MTRARSSCLLVVLVGTALLRAQTALAVTAAPPVELRFGAPFAVTLEHTWPVGGEPLPFDEASVRPLSLVLERSERSRDGEREVAVSHYRARCLATGEVAVPPFVVRTRLADGRVAAATATIGPFVVRSRLADPPGDVEWAGDVRDLPRPRGSLLWWVVGAAGVGGGALWFARRRVRPPDIAPAAAAAEVRVPGAVARAALAALGEPDAGDPAAVLRHATAIAAIVRAHAAAVGVARAPSRTSEELAVLVPAGRAPLAMCLGLCDRIKFAAHAPTRGELAALRAAAEAFVTATAATSGGTS